MVVHLARRHQPAPRDIPLRRAGFSRHRTVQPNHPRQGKLAAYADVLDAVIDRVRLDDITLVLHDLGGAVGLTYAASHPDRIRGLVAARHSDGRPSRPHCDSCSRVMGSAPVRALNVATNLIPRITAHNYGVGRHLTRAGRRAFLGGLADRRKRRSFHYLMRDARRSTATLATAEQALRGPLATKPLLTIFWPEAGPLRIPETVEGAVPARSRARRRRGRPTPSP